MLISIERAREWLKQTAQNEKRRFVKCISKSESFQTLQNLFKKRVPQIPMQEPPGRLESHIQHLESDEMIEEEELSLFESVEFKELSQLRKNKEDVDIPVPRGVLTSLFGHKKELSTENFESTIEYLSAFMDEALEEDNPLNENVKEALNEAMKRKELIRNLISEDEVDLKEIVNTLKEDVQEVSLDKPFIYFGELSVRRAVDALPFFDSFLKNELPEEFYELIHADGEKFNEKVQQYLLKNFQDRGWITEGLSAKKEQIEGVLKNIFNITGKAVSTVLPGSWYKAVAKSLKEDVLELALGVKPKNGSKRIGEAFCNNMMEQGLQSALESAIKDVFDQSRGVINNRIDDVVGGIADNIPKTVLQFASAYDMNISPQEHFWIEIRKQENGKGAICFFTHDLADGFDHTPLVFSDIEPEKLSGQFFDDLFFRLLSYQAWPEKEGVSYSLTDVHEVLVELIGKEEDDPNEDKIYPSNGSIRENFADYLKRYVHHHCKEQELDFNSLYHFDLPYQVLQDFWPEIEGNSKLLEDSSLRSELRKMIDQLSEMGGLFYEKKELDLEEMKKLTATLNEVRFTLEEYEKSTQIKPSFHSMLIPDELQAFVKKLQKETALNPTNVGDLKEIFVSVLGEDLEETIDLLIKEMLPEIEIENIKIHPKDKSWSEVFKLDEIKKFIRELRSMRLSLLHTYRVYARISSAIRFFLEFSIFSNFLEALIRVCIPQINLLIPFSITHLAKAMVLFGPGVIAKIMPKEVWNVFSSIFGLVHEVIKYVMRRVTLVVLGAVFRRILGAPQVEAAKLAVRKMQQKLTKTGELSFDLAQVESIEKPFTISRLPPVEDIELIEEEEEGIVELPHPYEIDLTPSNLKNELRKWCRDFEILKDCKADHFQGVKEQRALFFLNAQLRALPIPGSQEGELWNQIEEPSQIIELLHILCCSLRQKERATPEEATERIVSVYTLYAIIDKLARLCPQAYLTDEFKANGISFAKWMSSPLVQIYNIKTYHKVHQIAAYFEFKKGEEKSQMVRPFVKCSDKELDEYQRERLFNFTSCSKIFPFQQLKSTDQFSTKNATQVIELHNGGLRFSKDFAYYRSLLTKKEIIEKIERLGAQNSSEYEKMNILFGNFDQILPPSYSYLRLVHLMALQMVEKDVEEYKTHEFPDGILHLELEHQEVEKGENGFFSKVVKRAKEIGHTVTGSIFKSHVFATNLSFFPNQINGSEKVAKRKARHVRGEDLFSSDFEYGRYEFFKLITDPSTRSQSQILVEGPLNSGDLKRKEKAILEMLNTQEADQVVRALSFFDENKMLLIHPQFRFLFSLLINQSSALDMQLSQRAEVIENFGKIFQGMLDYFYSQEEIGTCLYLSQVGFEMRVQCQRFEQDAHQLFPDFNLFIQTNIAPIFRLKELSRRSFQGFDDGLVLCYLYIVSSYRFLDPLALSEEQKREVILSIAPLAYSKTLPKWVDSKLNVAIKSLDVIYLWEPYIKEALEQDPALRAEVIEGILEDAGVVVPQDEQEWEGSFPIYSKGGLRVDLEDFPLSSQPKIDVRAQAQVLGIKLTDEVKLSDSSYSYPKENITVALHGKYLTIKKELDGNVYRHLSGKEIDHQPFNLGENETLWIEDDEEETPLVLQIRETNIVARYFMELQEESYICIRSEKEFNGVFLEKVREEEKNGSLALLNWFQLPSKTELFKSGSDLKRMEFVELGLSFELIEEEVEEKIVKRAICCEGKFPGFYMAARQDEMVLRKYADSLLIENEEGDQKLLIAAQSFKQLIGIFFMKHIGGIATSPFIDSTVKGILEESDLQKNSSFDYTVTDKGKLETKDTAALFYLVFFHFAHGRFKESMLYFSQLEAIGHQESFSLQILSSMDQILIPLLMAQNPQAEQLFLKLSALREKNELLNRTEREFSQLDLLRWMAVQVKYFRYLKKIQTGAYAYLDDVQELFLIKSIERLSKTAIQKQFPNLFKESSDGEGIEGLLKKLGVDELAGHLLMMPLISHRHRELRSKFKDGNHWSRKTEGLFLNALFGEESKVLDLQKVNKIFSDPVEKSSLVVKVFSAYRKTMERSYCSSQDATDFDYTKVINGFVQNDQNFEQGLTPMTLDSLTPKWISIHFLYLYRLALGKMPSDWTGLEGKEALFNTHKKAFEYYFSMLSGKIHDREERFLFNVLEMVSKGSSLFTSYAEPDRLDELMEEMASPEEEVAKNAKERLESILKSLILQSSKWAFKNAFWKMTGLRGSNAPKVVLEIGQKTAKFVLNKGFKTLLNKILSTPVKVVNAVSGIYQAVKTVYQEETSVVKSEKQEKCLELKRREIEPSLKEKMNQREEGINHCMQELLEKYFEIEDIELQREQVLPYENLDEEFNQNIRDFNSRPNVIETKYTLKEGLNGEDLWEDLNKIQKEVSSWLKMERESIKRFANHNFKQEKPEEEQILEQLMKGSEKRIPLTFEEISKAFIQQKDSELKGRSRMGDGQLEQLKECLFLYLVLASRWNLLFEQMNKGASLEVLAAELDRSRVYDFEDMPELLVLANLKFEATTKKMMRVKPFEQIKEVLLNKDGHQNQISEQLMGSGKTWCFFPFLHFWAGDGDQLSISVSPAAVAKANMSTISGQAQKVFGQLSHWISVIRGGNWSEDLAFAIYYTVEGARLRGDLIAMTKEQIQALELVYLEMEFSIKGLFSKPVEGREIKNTKEYLRRTLRVIRESGIEGTDEIQKASDRKKELNYPLGKRKFLEKRFIKVMREVLFHMMSAEELKIYLTIASEKPSPLALEEYKQVLAILAPCLVEKMTLFKEVVNECKKKIEETENFKKLKTEKQEEMIQELTKKVNSALVEYISTESKQTPGFISKSAKCKEIDMIRGMLLVLNPMSLKETIHVHFNASNQENNGEQARPSEGNNNTQEESTIRSPYEAFVKTALMLLHDRLNEKQLDKFISYLKEGAIKRAEKELCKRSQTVEARFFKKHCKEDNREYKLFAFEEKDKEEVHRLLNGRDDVILAYAEHLLWKEFFYFEWNLSSNSYNFLTQGAKNIGGTGTKINMGRYLQGTNLVDDPGTDGESASVMERKCFEIVILEQEAPHAVLTEIIESFFENDSSCLVSIDLGAYFNGIIDEDVAKVFMEKVVSNREDLKGVAFYKDGLMVTEKGGSELIPLEETKIQPKQRLSYYSQARAFALHIDQDPKARAVITIAEDTTFSDFAQALYRMRKLDEDQDFIVALLGRVRDRMKPANEVPTIQEIISFLRTNENSESEENSYEGDKQQLYNVIRRALLDKAEFAVNSKAATNVIFKYYKIFVNPTIVDPSILFGNPLEQKEPKDIFIALRKKYYAIIKKSKEFTEDEEQKIAKKLNAIGNGTYPPLVSIYSVKGEINTELLNDLNKETQISMHDKLDIDVMEEQEMQIQVHQHQNQEELQVDKKIKPQVFYPWPKNLQPTLLEWLKVVPVPKPGVLSKALSGLKTLKNQISQKMDLGNVPIYRMHNVFESMIKGTGKYISKFLLTTNNMTYLDASNGCVIAPFGRYQVPVFEMLVVKRPQDKETLAILIDQKEGEYWREKLIKDSAGKCRRDEKVKIGIYDLSLGLVAEGFKKFEKELESEGFKELLVQVKFLSGAKNYNDSELEILEKWLRKDVSMSMIELNNKWVGTRAEKMINKLLGKDEKKVVETF